MTATGGWQAATRFLKKLSFRWTGTPDNPGKLNLIARMNH
jgi:hypothetical protein